jgi:hypothetical protein
LFPHYKFNHVTPDILQLFDAFLLNFQKHCAKSSKNGVLIKDYPDLQDYIKEKNAHFKEIDEFELLVEEVD